MSSVDRLQSARYEFKYLIDEPAAEQIQRFVLGHLAPDQFTAGREGRGYAVHSLYLDSHDFGTCWAVIQGEKNRYKLRVRFYDDDPGHPVFFEIKRRVNVVILKERAPVLRERAEDLLAGAAPRVSDLQKPDNKKHWKALLNFCSLRDRIHAQPAAYTSYLREGYEAHGDNSVRVTFDRELKAGIYRGSLSIADLDRWAVPDMGGVVLELKFTDRFPTWMHTLVQWFNLTRVGFPKYVKCVALVHGFKTDGRSYDARMTTIH